MINKKKTILTGLSLILTAVLIAGCNVPSPSPVTEVTTSTGSQTVPEKVTTTLNLITEVRVYDQAGELISISKCTYDDKGLLLSEQREGIHNSTLNGSYVYSYNDHGHLISRTEHQSGQDTPRIVLYDYSYNANGTIASISGYFDGDSSEPDMYFEYDGQGRFKKATTPYYDGTIWDYFTCDYGENGKLSKVTIKVPNYTLVYNFSYDDQNRLIGVGDFGSFHSYEYDKYGNLIQDNTCHYTYSAPNGVITNLQDTSNPNTTYAFDNQGRLSQVFGEHGGRIEYNYQTIELSPENLGLSRKYLTIRNEAADIGAYCNDILAYLLPKAFASYI